MGNTKSHIIRIKKADNKSTAKVFAWDTFNLSDQMAESSFTLAGCTAAATNGQYQGIQLDQLVGGQLRMQTNLHQQNAQQKHLRA